MIAPENRRWCRYVVLLGCFAFLAGNGFAQTPDEIRRAFIDLHDDKVPHNCEHATEWLFKHREKLQSDLLDELYKTDWQGRESLMRILLYTESFKPDDRFIHFICGSLLERFTDREDWKLIDDRYAEFEPGFRQVLSRTGDPPHGMFVLWCITWLAKKHGLLGEYLPLYSSALLQKAAANLKDDETTYNASQAVRFFLIIGDKGVPTLRETGRSSNAQAASLARALIDALGGSRNAFGFLGSKTGLETTPFGPSAPTPPWHGELVWKNMDKETYP